MDKPPAWAVEALRSNPAWAYLLTTQKERALSDLRTPNDGTPAWTRRIEDAARRFDIVEEFQADAESLDKELTPDGSE